MVLNPSTAFVRTPSNAWREQERITNGLADFLDVRHVSYRCKCRFVVVFRVLLGFYQPGVCSVPLLVLARPAGFRHFEIRLVCLL